MTRRRAWSKIEEAYRNKTDMTGKVVDNIKGGLVVDIGVRAFLPASQADLHPVRDLDQWKDREITVRVLKMNRKRGNIVVSRRAILDDQVAVQRKDDARIDGRRANSERCREERHRATARLSIWAASMDCCISRICRGAASRARWMPCVPAKKWKSRF